ncbi:HK97 gp10 family phage protein [Actinomadura sp. ATCC 31491]|uniref:HK97 gp10 family phage protein n=1 Tax=Actinomadura luzonensis TaxID=2805427 RepID=A0ABT0FQU0_9ACTN|nr:HK97 gp10 family phage protein [Actinomadura luzonensis]MCK2214288.1 HK97 gp10 family phage protein [Actinomadura luzonensis]
MAGASQEIRRLVRDLGKIPPEVRKELRPAIKQIGNVVVQDARGRASWSTRIPGAIRLGIQFSTGSRAGVTVIGSVGRAPHLRVYEHLGFRAPFRHPVYGRNVWVSEMARPFLFPAVAAHAEDVDAKIGEAIDKVARAHGFR